MVFEDSSSSEEEEDDEDFKTLLGMIFNDDIRRPRRGSRFGRMHINRDRAEGHAKIMRDYFAPKSNLSEEILSPALWDAHKSFSDDCRSH